MANEGLRVLVLGSGAREHALAVRLAASERVASVAVAPGNGGTERELGASGPVQLDDPAGVVAAAREAQADLVVVGPEAPLVAGAADALREAGFAVFGPGAAGAKLEGSKAFFKEFASRYKLPTAEGRAFSDPAAAHAYVDERGGAVVVKADGLCAGKGVVVASSAAEAHEAVEQMMVARVFGDAGASVVIEERLDGEEASIHVITDGRGYLVLPAVQDHKRLLDGDRGPNTGGMGAYGPAPRVDEHVMAHVIERLVEPLLVGLHRDRIDYRGVLFLGLMITPSGDPMLLEINARFGDPETAVLMAMLDEDIAQILDDAARGKLARVGEAQCHGHAAAVVLASEGYPSAPRKGQRIEGLDHVIDIEATYALHAGTVWRDGAFFTSGGRVLCLTSQGDSLQQALSRAYQACSVVRFEGMQFRRDIGHRALGRAVGRPGG